MGVLKAAEGQAEMVEPVRQRRADHRDPGAAHLGEVRQPQTAGLMRLAEDHLPLRPMQRPPLTDAPLQRAPDAVPELGVTAQELRQDRNRTQAGRCLQHWHDFGVEDFRKGIGAAPIPRDPLLRRQARILLDAIGGGRAKSRPRRGDGDRIGRSVLHEEPHLVIRHVAVRHERSPRSRERAPNTSADRDHPLPAPPRRVGSGRRQCRTSAQATPSLRSDTGETLSS